MALEDLQKLKKLELEIYESVMAGIAKVSDEAMVHAQNQVEAVKKELAEIEAQIPPPHIQQGGTGAVDAEGNAVAESSKDAQAASNAGDGNEAGNSASGEQAGAASTDAGADQDAGGTTEENPVEGASTK